VLKTFSEGETYKGKPISFYVTVEFEIETQMLDNGLFQTSYDSYKASLCTQK